MNISVIVPVLNEEKSIAATLLRWSHCDPTKSSLSMAAVTIGRREIRRRFGVKLISSERGRARQMNRGAQQAIRRGVVVSPCRHAFASVRLWRYRRRARDPRYVGGRFDVALEGSHRMLAARRRG